MRWLVRWCAEYVLAVAAALVTLCLLEGGLRLYYVATYPSMLQELAKRYQPPPPGATVTLVDSLRPSPFPRIVFELKPNLQVLIQGVPVRTNADGWRERSRGDSNESAIRIAGIGDSFMFGWGVAEDERYMSLLERSL